MATRIDFQGMDPYLLEMLDPFRAGFEISAEELPEEAAQILQERQAEFGDTIDSKEELRSLFEALQATGAAPEGLELPAGNELQNLSSAEMLQLLIDWVANGGPQREKQNQAPRMHPGLPAQTAPIQAAPAWNPATSGGGGGGHGGGGHTHGGGGHTHGGGSAPTSTAPAGTVQTDVRPPNGETVMPLPEQYMDLNDHDFGEDRGTHAHAGEDWGAPTGTPIYAAADGEIASIGPNGAYGNLVTVRHDDGTETRYAHMSAFGQGLEVGDRVGAGTVLGAVGNTGRSTGPHLHFEVRQNGQPVPPNEWLQGATYA
ncbi:MAG: M23 family metallopeptidase [Deltaproteobacteria bacterium]|jgi:murein DD-endopeptidase MepM/ murein hydrolase activator NlpD